MAFSCSKECQHLAWNDHKKECRKPGEFKVGDKAYTLQAFGEAKHGNRVEILAESLTDTGYLVVSFDVYYAEVPDSIASVPVDRLRRMRPELWDTCTVGIYNTTSSTLKVQALNMEPR